MKIKIIFTLLISFIIIACNNTSNKNTDEINLDSIEDIDLTPEKSTEIFWDFENDSDNKLMPFKKCILTIGNKQYTIDQKFTGEFIELDKPEFISFNVPANAISACSGEWDNLQTIVFLLENKNEYIVKMAEVDLENTDKEIEYKALKTISK